MAACFCHDIDCRGPPLLGSTALIAEPAALLLLSKTANYDLLSRNVILHYRLSGLRTLRNLPTGFAATSFPTQRVRRGNRDDNYGSICPIPNADEKGGSACGGMGMDRPKEPVEYRGFIRTCRFMENCDGLLKGDGCPTCDFVRGVIQDYVE